MKIFFVGRGWPSAREPQWGSFERDQAIALSKMGHQVVALSVDTRFRLYYRKLGITKEINEEIPHYDLFPGSLLGKPLRMLNINLYIKIRRYLFMRLFEQVIKDEGMPDLLYGHYLGGASIALGAKEKYGIPVVGIEHWSEIGYKNIKPSIKYWASTVYKNLDCLISVSYSLKENIKKVFGMDAIVVNNMVGDEFYYVPNSTNDQQVRYVTTGNLLPVKGFDNLIKAFSILNLPSNSWMLNIIGGGKEYENLQHLIDRAGLSNNIHLCGRKNREGVIDMLHNSDVYVMSSRSETFGVAAIEALACGLPVVATDCGGAREFLTKENGILCPVNDIYKLSDALFHMYKYHNDYDRETIAKKCQEIFSSKAIATKLEIIFEKILRKRQTK